MSKSGNYYDFGRSFPLEDDDGITVNAASRELNKINNMVDINRLAEFTSAGIFASEAGPDGNLTPTTIVNKSSDLSGASTITPTIINDRAVYFQTFNHILRDSAYSFETDGFTGINLSLYSDHFFKTYPAVEMAYQKDPFQTLWIIREDGKLVSLTYTKQAEIYGWAIHETCNGNNYFYLADDVYKGNGNFESICCVPGATNDEVYFVVDRFIPNWDGDTHYRYIEKLSNRNASSDPRKQVFLDCSFTTDNPKIITKIESRPVTFYSLAHGFTPGDTVEFSEIGDDYTHAYTKANGKRYVIDTVTTDTFSLSAADSLAYPTSYGAYLYGEARKTFSGVTLPTGMHAYSDLRCLVNGYNAGVYSAGVGTFPSGITGSIAVVGMPFISECETTNIDFDTTAGSTQQKVKEVSNSSVGVFETYGGKIGTDRSNMYTMTNNLGAPLSHSLTSGQPTGTPPALFSGIFNQSVISGSSNPLSIIIRQEDPYPMTLLNINAEVEIGE
jgi:hypothetical protein